MARIVVLILLLGMINYSFSYWLAWKNSPNGEQIEDTESESTECTGNITNVECRVAYTKQPWSDITGVSFQPGYNCSITNGLWCLSGSLPGGRCPDFEIRYFCSDPTGQPIYHWELTSGPRGSTPGLTAEEYCQSQPLNPLDYNVDHTYGSYSLVPAPDVLNYACAISITGGAHINLGDFRTTCISDPTLCSSGQSTWSIWLKINHGENINPAMFVSSGGISNIGVDVRLEYSLFKCRVTVASKYWYKHIPQNLIPDGIWFHLGLLIDTSAETFNVHINGVPYSSTLFTKSSEVTSSVLLLGTISGLEGQKVAAASYSDLMIYEKILSGAEISEIRCGILGGVTAVWSLQQMEVSNPNELHYQCLYKTLDDIGNNSLKWFLYLNNGGVLSREELFHDSSPSRDSLCFYKSELVINKYTRLVRDEYAGTQMLIVCEVFGTSQYESIQIEDFAYAWTPWYSSTKSRDSSVGDNETLAHILEVYPDACAYPVAIECRERYTMKSFDYLVLKENLVNTHCDIGEGLLCRHDDQGDGSCPDFEVRTMCLGERDHIEIHSMLIKSLSSEVLEAECRTRDNATYQFSWSLYNATSDLQTDLSGASTGVTVLTSSQNGGWLSELTIADQFDKNLMGLFVTCNVSSEKSHVEESLRIDNAFYGTVFITASTMAIIQTGSNVTLTCTADGDTVHNIEWIRKSLNNTVTNLDPLEPYNRSSYIGGTSQLEILDIQSEDYGSYFCNINWGSIEVYVNVMLGTIAVQPPTSSQSTTAPEVLSHDPQAGTDGAVSGSSATQTSESLSTEILFTNDASTVLTPTWCAVGDVLDIQMAVTCGSSNHIDVEPGKLTDAKKEQLVNFLKIIALQPAEQLTMFSETAAVTNAVLMVFSKLTDPDQSLTIQEETAVMAVTEEALNVLAKTLQPKTCSTLGYEAISVNLCNVPTVGLLSSYSFTSEVPLSHDDAGIVTDSFEETLGIDVSDLDPDAEDVGVVVLRMERPVHGISKVKYLEQTDNLQAPNETWIQLNSGLLAFSIFVQGQRISVPITFSLYHLEDVKNESRRGDSTTINITRNSICAFVDSADDQDVQWSSFGCEVIQGRSSSKHSICACNHSTNFAVLMQVKSYEISRADSLALTWITYIGCGTSMVMLILTLAVFFYLGRMLRSDRSFIHSNLSIAILLAQILFIAGIDRTENRGVCKAVALLLHFCYLSVFAWMLVEGIHLYMKIVKVYGSENIKMYPYLFIGWGIPIVITLVSFGASNDGYGSGNSCWLDTSSGLIWAFVAPALLVIVLNMIVLSLVVRIVIKSAQLRQEKKYDHIKAGIKGAIMLLPILGLTWVFGLLAVNSATIVFQYLFTIFNSFQGLFIFLINCLFNAEVRSAFVRKREKQKMSHERETMEHSMSFVYTTKNSPEAKNTAGTRGRSEHDRKENYTDVTSLRSGSPPSRPGSGSSLLDVTHRKNMKRPHCGKVSPLPISEEPEMEYN